jgi:hypothetical protein
MALLLVSNVFAMIVRKCRSYSIWIIRYVCLYVRVCVRTVIVVGTAAPIAGALDYCC